MEDQRANACEEQRGAHVEPGDEGNEDGGAKHGEEVLHTEHHKLGLAQLAGIVNALNV